MLRARSDRQVSKLFQYDFRGKKPWTVEEDTLLKELTDKHGTGNWTFIAQHFVERSGKQCRERWHNHLNPGIKKGDWTAEEDHIIVTMQQLWGNQWAKITTMLPGRTDNAVKNRFHATLRATKGKKCRANQISLGKNDFDDSIVDETMDDDLDTHVAQPFSVISDDDVSATGPIVTDQVFSGADHLTLYSNTTREDFVDDGDLDLESNPVSESFGSIDTLQLDDFENPTIAENCVPLEIDIDGLRDWMTDDLMEIPMEVDDYCDNHYDRRSNGCFSRLKNDAMEFATNPCGWKSEDSHCRNLGFSGFAASICDRSLGSSDRQNIAHERESSSFCSSFSHVYLQRR